mgnify:CR=1 FL=1
MMQNDLPGDETRPPQIIYALYLAGIVTALLWPLLAVWLGVRCVLGWVDVRKGRPPARPASWLW